MLSGKGELIVHWAEELAQALSRLARAQMRNFYGPLIRIRESLHGSQDDAISKLHLMRARLHYMAARERQAGPLRDVFDQLIPRIQSREQLKALFDFAEALVSYHRECSRN